MVARVQRIEKVILLIFVIILVAGGSAVAQKKKQYLKRKNKMISRYKGGSIHFSKNKRYLSLEFNVNSLNYFGDLAPTPKKFSTDISFTRPGFGFTGVYRYSPAFSFRGGLDWGRIMADDAESQNPNGDVGDKGRYIRNLSFRNDLIMATGSVMYDFFPNHGTFLNRVEITPYAFGGFTVMYSNPQGKVPDKYYNTNPAPEAGKWVSLRKLGTEGQHSDAYPNNKPYSPIQIAIPVGLGVRMAASKRVDVSFEMGYRILFTDYIDDAGGLYVDLGALDSDLAKTMSDRSRETHAAISGKPRNMQLVFSRGVSTYEGIDGKYYTYIGGYGIDEHDPLKTGKRGDEGNDQLWMFSLKVSYIISGSFQRAKFR